MPVASVQAQAESRALIARFFIDLRQALRLTVPQAAYYLAVRSEVVEALETGQVEYLPPWPETSAIIMTYTSMAGVNGRPVLNAIGTLFTQLSVRAAPPPAWPPQEQTPSRYAPQSRALQPPSHDFRQPHERATHYSQQPQHYQQPRPQQQRPMPLQDYRAFEARSAPSHIEPDEDEPDIARFGLQASSRNLLKAGSAIASGARRLPQQALNQVRQRPQRALYALSLPLGLLVIMMHSSILATVYTPFEMVVQRVSTYIQEHYGPVRDGMRYIEVDDPETRRADKLQIGGGSY